MTFIYNLIAPKLGSLSGFEISLDNGGSDRQALPGLGGGGTTTRPPSGLGGNVGSGRSRTHPWHHGSRRAPAEGPLPSPNPASH